MKTSILTALLVIGVVLLGAMNPATGSPASVSTSVQHQALIQTTAPTNLSNTVGSGLTGCWSFVGADGDTYAFCCLDLWLFSVCVSVDASAVSRLIDSIF